MSAGASSSSGDVRHTAASSSAADAAAPGLQLITYNLGICSDDWGSKQTRRWLDVERDFRLLLCAPEPHVVLLQECGPYGRVVGKVASDIDMCIYM